MNTAKHRYDFRRLLKREVRPGSKALVVGPGVIRERVAEETKGDPSTYYLNSLLKGKGTLVALDAKHVRQLERVSAYGGIKQFRRSWTRVTKEPAPSMVVGTASRMPYKSKSFDIIYDHSAMPFIRIHNRKLGEDPALKLAGIVSEYLRVLKPGGKIILTSPFAWHSGNPILQVIPALKWLNMTNVRPEQLTMRQLLVNETPYKIDGKTAGSTHAAKSVLIIEKKKSSAQSPR